MTELLLGLAGCLVGLALVGAGFAGGYWWARKDYRANRPLSPLERAELEQARADALQGQPALEPWGQ